MNQKNPPNKKPNGISVAGEEYRATVMLINTRDPTGRPKLVTILHDDQEIEIAGGEEFLIAYVSRKMLRKTKGPDAEPKPEGG